MPTLLRATLFGLWLTARILPCAGAQETLAEPPPLVVIGPVLTMDPARPRAEGVVIRRGLVELVADRESVRDRITEETVVIAVPEGGVAIPGIIDSHAHLMGIGRARRQLDLREATSAVEVAARVREASATLPPGAWILGRGWNQELWAENTFPDRSVLDAATAAHPVALTRVDGHALWVNSAVLSLAGITPDTASPEGGEILKDATGRPTGILVDNAMALVRRHQPLEDDPEELQRDALAAQEAAFSQGVTTLVDAGAGIPTLVRLNQLYAEGLMKLRIYVMLSVGDTRDLETVMNRNPIRSLYQDRVSVRALKLYADGALGSRGAWLLEPYADRPGYSGLSTQPPAFIETVARQALERGYQVCVHAIGDRAIRETLNAFSRALEEAPPEARLDHRFRIEHAQIVDAADIPRFARLGVLPSMQTCHCTSDGPWVPDRIGEARTAEGAYAWRSFLDAGCVIPNGTDAPVEPLSPWANLQAAIGRMIPAAQGHRVFHPEQRLDRLEALKSLTVWGAFGIFAEDRRGMLRPGYEGDLVVIDRDPTTCSFWDLAGTRVKATVVAGEVVYRAL